MIFPAAVAVPFTPLSTTVDVTPLSELVILPVTNLSFGLVHPFALYGISNPLVV